MQHWRSMEDKRHKSFQETMQHWRSMELGGASSQPTDVPVEVKNVPETLQANPASEQLKQVEMTNEQTPQNGELGGASSQPTDVPVEVKNVPETLQANTASLFTRLSLKTKKITKGLRHKTNVQSMEQGKAIPLCLPNNLSWDPITGEIRKSKDTRCFLYPVPAAIEMLKAIKEPVCVVSIAGPCRDGKSYILGEVFGQTNVFSLGHEMDPETMGLWMHIVPQKVKDSRGRDLTVILLDSEGIDAVTAQGQNDKQIFTLTVLLASVLIYNSKGVPKRNDLNNLKFIVNLSQRIRIRSKGGRDDQDLFRNTFPFFIWLLRDVTQKLPSDCEEDINKYFSTRVFTESTNTTSEEKDQQIVTEGILAFFSGFQAFTLPPPSSDVDVMQDICKNRKKLNRKFIEGVKGFESLLKSKLAPKPSINKGENITGDALGVLVQLYTDAINDPDAIPNVEMAWDTYVKTKCSEAKKGALEMYDQVMTELMSSTELPCEGDEILKNHEMAQRKSMEIFEEETAHLISTNIRWELNELMESTDKNVKTWKDKNASRTRHSCKDLLRELKTRHLDPVLKSISGSCETRASYADIMNGLKTIKKEFHKKAVGAKDIKAEVFFEFNQYLQEEVLKYQEILGKMKDDDEALARQKMIAAYKEKETKRLQEDIAQLNKREETWKRRINMIEDKQQKEIREIRKQTETEKLALNETMSIMKEANSNLQLKFKQQFNAAAERERRSKQEIQKMQQAYYNERQKVLDQKQAAKHELVRVAQLTDRQICFNMVGAMNCGDFLDLR